MVMGVWEEMMGAWEEMMGFCKALNSKESRILHLDFELAMLWK